MRKQHSKITLAASTILFTLGANTAFAQCNSTLFAGGAGTEASPYQISTAQQLQNLNECLGEDYAGNYYILNNDIDLSPYLLSSYLSGDENDRVGWQPIGISDLTGTATIFYGSFNGNGHKVSGLWINRSIDDDVGLFGCSGYEILNVSVEIDNDKGGIKGSKRVGGLVGVNEGGAISNSYVIGNVAAIWAAAGGLVGVNVGGTISNSYATGNVSGGEAIGGLVGTNNSGTISNSYATGYVLGYEIAGGLVGWSSGTISNSYAVEYVSGDKYVGGLVGHKDNGTISNSYATGSVSGDEYVGGLVGYNNNNGSITSSYYDNQTSGQTDEDNGEGKSTAEMKTQSTYVDWDFTSIWEINPTKNNGYPTLQPQVTTPIIPIKASPKIAIQTTPNSILLSNLQKNTKVDIYNLQGKRLYSTNSENSKILRIPVQTKGMYIIKAGTQTVRVAVR